MLPAIIVTFVVTALLAWLLTRVRGRWRVLDIPNERSLHTQPTPRTGGVAMLAGAGAGMFTAWHKGYVIADTTTVTAILTLALVALVDDRHNLGAGLRLLVQSVVVAVLLYFYRLPDMPVMLLPVALLFLVWMINLYNFMDGMDGFAAGMAGIGFGTYCLAGLAGRPHGVGAGLCRNRGCGRRFPAAEFSACQAVYGGQRLDGARPAGRNRHPAGAC